MKPAVISFLIAILIFASGVGNRELYAQLGGCTHDSIEWLTVSSDVVVVASVTDLTYKDRPPEVGEQRSQWQWVTVTLTVRTALKGARDVTKLIVFTKELPRGAETLPKWKKSGQAVLWFLVENGEKGEELPPDLPAQLRNKPLFHERKSIELGSPKTRNRVPTPALSMDLLVLDRTEKILAAVKAETARRNKGPLHAACIPISHELASRAGRAGDFNELRVPVREKRLSRE